MTVETGNGGQSPTANRAIHYTHSKEMIFRIPGRDSARNEITHKKMSEMNRTERRAVLADLRKRR